MRKLFGLVKEGIDLEKEKLMENEKESDKAIKVRSIESNNYVNSHREDIENIGCYIDYEFEVVRKQEEKEKNVDDSSEKVKTKPDFIQTIAMNLSQSNPKITENLFTKRKNPFSQVIKATDDIHRQSILNI